MRECLVVKIINEGREMISARVRRTRVGWKEVAKGCLGEGVGMPPRRVDCSSSEGEESMELRRRGAEVDAAIV